MDDTATTCDHFDPDAIGSWLWITRTPPQAVALRTRVGFGALGLDPRPFAHTACAGFPSSAAVGTPTRESLSSAQASHSQQRPGVTMRRAATRWSLS